MASRYRKIWQKLLAQLVGTRRGLPPLPLQRHPSCQLPIGSEVEITNIAGLITSFRVLYAVDYRWTSPEPAPILLGAGATLTISWLEPKQTQPNWPPQLALLLIMIDQPNLKQCAFVLDRANGATPLYQGGTAAIDDFVNSFYPTIEANLLGAGVIEQPKLQNNQTTSYYVGLSELPMGPVLHVVPLSVATPAPPHAPSMWGGLLNKGFNGRGPGA